ncbi:hypothetical protein PRZ48_009771 [Zasmidium cellare]|uniref:Mandelate racemase/muconate lactonizing enzyme C-terminal domain-containing protein n=1 Tax=Zasmidium cellare TaxID=395010 RepID=A0ABR0EDP6_ZASCE|nr:hypothetical protein PRZ48_009771 [Zasmidium cellare]
MSSKHLLEKTDEDDHTDDRTSFDDSAYNHSCPSCQRYSRIRRHATLASIILVPLLLALLLTLVAINLSETHALALQPQTEKKVYGHDRRYMSLAKEYDPLWALDAIGRGAISLPLTPSSTEPLPGLIGMFHQLHCLAGIRHALQRAKAGEDIGINDDDDGHWPHCFHYLREAILCAADDTVERQRFMNGSIGTEWINGQWDVRTCGGIQSPSTRLYRELKTQTQTQTMASNMAPELKIARIDVYQVDLGYSGDVYRLSGGRELSSFDATIVRVTTQTGIEGFGESTPFGSTYIAAHPLGIRAAIAELAPKLIGLDPRRTDRINDVMDANLTGHESAKSAIDLACWDVFGKSVGLPVCELLGGRTDAKLPIICSLSAGSPDDIGKELASFRSRGYTCFSVKISGKDPAEDVERVKTALSNRRPGDFYTIDANGGMTVEGALRMLRLMPPDLDFVLEQPCGTWRECLSLRRRTNIPIIFDELATTEASLLQMIRDDAAEGISMKIAKCGGLTKARRARDICVAAGYTIGVFDSAGSDIAFAAIVHLAQTVPDRLLHCVFECREMSTGKTADGEYEHREGRIQAPSTPGLGITPRMDVLGEPVASYE